MRAVTVTALKAFTYRGEPIAAGEVTTRISPIDALALARQKLVSLAKHTYTTREMSVTVSDEPEQPTRRYRRRDMQAEDR